LFLKKSRAGAKFEEDSYSEISAELVVTFGSIPDAAELFFGQVLR